MGVREFVLQALGRSPASLDDVAIQYTQAMLAGDTAAVARLSAATGQETSKILVARFAEADLARWFGRFRSLNAPASSLPLDLTRPVERRYVVGRVTLPNNAVQDFPIMTVALMRDRTRWMIVGARANARLFDDGTAEPSDELDLIEIDSDDSQTD